MLKSQLNLRPPRRSISKYVGVAAVIAIASVAIVEAAGTMLSRSYTGLGGKLAPPSAIGAPSPSSSNVRDAAPHATPGER